MFRMSARYRVQSTFTVKSAPKLSGSGKSPPEIFQAEAFRELDGSRLESNLKMCKAISCTVPKKAPGVYRWASKRWQYPIFFIGLAHTQNSFLNGLSKCHRWGRVIRFWSRCDLAMISAWSRLNHWPVSGPMFGIALPVGNSAHLAGSVRQLTVIMPIMNHTLNVYISCVSSKNARMINI